MSPQVCTPSPSLFPSPKTLHEKSCTISLINPPKGARVTSVAEYGKALDLFQSRGYSEVDTARVYVGGKQEAFSREVGWQERGLTLATKVKYPSDPGDNTADKVAASVELSLKELGAEYVDLLYLHAAVGGWLALYLLLPFFFQCPG